MNKHLASIVDAVKSLRSEHAGLRSRLERAKREREELAALPLAPADVVAAVRQHLDERRPAVLERLAARLRSLEVNDGDVVYMLRQQCGITGGNRLVESDTDRKAIDSELLALVLDEGLLKLCEAALQSGDRAKKTIALAKRRSEIARLDAEIASIEQDLETTRDAAASAGVGLQ